MPAVAAIVLALTGLAPPINVEVLRSIGGLPPHIAGLFEEPLGFQQTPGGPYYVFDRRGHSVHTVDEGGTSVRTLVDIGAEEGRLLDPSAFGRRIHNAVFRFS